MFDIVDKILRTAANFERRDESLENPKYSLSNPPPSIWGDTRTKAGVSVNQNTAMGLTAFWACVKIISETIASLPLITYRQTGDQNKERAKDIDEYYVLHDQFNNQMTSMIARELAHVNVLTRGNYYFLIQRNRLGRLLNLWPLSSDKTSAVRTAGVLYYETTDTNDGKMQRYAAEDVLHVPGLGFNGISGLSPIAMHRETIGHGIATEQYGSAFFGEGGRPAGTLETPETLTDEGYIRLKNDIKDQTQNPHRTLILEQGLKYHVITIPPEDAQYIETRKFNVSDMARIFRMPLAMLEEHDKAAAYASVEQFFLQFAVHTIRPWLIRSEQEYNRKIFGIRSELICEHNMDALLRGDLKSRYDAYHQAWQDGWMVWDEIREKENMNEVPAGAGKVHFVPANQIPVDRALNPPKQAPPATTDIPAARTAHGPNGKELGGGEGQ